MAQTVLIEDVLTPETNKLKSLGLTITNKLSWNDHILSLISKASKRLFVLRKHKNILPRQALEKIYTTMIRPILEYGDVIYDNASLSIGQSLENIQRQAAIACTGAYRHTKHKTLLSEVGWETFSSRRRQHKLCLFFKIFKHIYPGYLFRFLVFSANSGYNLRNNHVLIPRFSRLTISFHSFFPSTTREWNKLSHQIQNSISANSFKSCLHENTKNPFYKMCTGKQGIST